MNRDIKFRGIGKADKKWIYGDLRLGGIYKDAPAIIDHRLDDADFDGEISLSPEVYPETISQYTGFKDANGNEVYEYDIIKCDYLMLEVLFDKTRGFYPIIMRLDGSEEKCALTLGAILNGEQNAIVVGNRFDNPEPTPSRTSDAERAFSVDDINDAMDYLGFDREQIANVINRLKRKS